MGLNKVKPGSQMYQFINATWNPLAGKCFHLCSYCSTNNFYYPVLIKKYSGEIRIEESELKTNLGNGNFIFVVAQNDLFAENVPEEMIHKILEYCRNFDNKYLFQTKNPKRILDFELPNSVICTTIESDVFYPEIMVNSPEPYERAKYMEILSDCGFETFITIEPILKFNLEHMVKMIKRCNPKQVNIGANTFFKIKLPEPSKEKILELISELQKFTTIHNKSNLKRLLT